MQSNKRVILANPRGFCAGVDRAIAIVERALTEYGKPVYVRHEVVHNKYVVDDLSARGAIFVDDINAVPEGAVLIYSAHGVSKQVRLQAQSKKLRFIFDATCPLVSKVHTEVRNLYNKGYIIVMIGHRSHPEVEGTMGQIDSNIYLVENINDIDNLSFNNDCKIAVVTQTTLSVDDTKEIIDRLKTRFPGLYLPKNEDICYATQNRQDAVKKIAPMCDIMLVLGSQASSNSNRLRELSEKLNVRAYLIDCANDLKDEWLDNVNTVGVTAGASAPEILVTRLLAKLKTQGFHITNDVHTTKEDIVFALPSELRV